MAKFIKVKDIKEGASISSVQTMIVPDHLLHQYKNCDWYKSGKWVELKDETNTSIAAAEPIKREDYINISNDFVSVAIESETAMKLKPKENILEVPDEKIVHKGVKPMISNERTITKEENEKLIREKIEDLPKIQEMVDKKSFLKGPLTEDQEERAFKIMEAVINQEQKENEIENMKIKKMKPEEKEPVKKKGKPKKS